PWNPSRTIPIIAFHSYKDMNIQYYGGATIGSTGTYFPPQDSILGIIATNYLCQVRKQTLFHDSVKYDHFKYSNCSGNSIIEQYISYDGEHSWPGGLSLSGTSVSQQFNATFLMWEFFKNYKTTGINAVIAEKELSPYSLTLLQNFPNPFNPSTTIRYSLSTPTDVRLSIVDALGREIATLIDAQQSPGEKEVQWNVRDAASGVYFCILRAGNIVVSKKLLLTK
ncbi:MAG: T9SS type A sorting domain-containing protein, partial [Bacteroidota bacterium]